MTRENKLALVIGFGLMLFVGILVSDHFSAQRFDPATVAQAESAAPAEPIKLDAFSNDALVAQGGSVDLAKDGASALPDAAGVNGGEQIATDPAPMPIEVAKADGTPVRFHKVQKGETYWSIAAREYGDGALANKLQEYNKAVAPDAAKLTLNSELRIPSIEVLKPGATARTAVDGAVAQAKVEAPVAARVAASYTIQKGDTPYAIARKQGVKVAELLKFNGIKDPSALKPGQSLKIPTKG
ncbi:MAG: LysM peptidoglycan-binding domain-containing protein [Planctomycetota bacterium]|nr:LysM peptidoglycan-binding domain-containing protein [Planctomycetota bacterium]